MKDFTTLNAFYGAYGGIMALRLWIYVSGRVSASTGLLQYEIAMATQFGWIFSQRGCQGDPGNAIRQV